MGLDCGRLTHCHVKPGPRVGRIQQLISLGVVYVATQLPHVAGAQPGLHHVRQGLFGQNPQQQEGQEAAPADPINLGVLGSPDSYEGPERQKISQPFREAAPLHSNHAPAESMHLLIQSVEDCFVRDRNVDWVLKSLGLKNQRLLFKGGVRANLSFVLMYLREDLLPAWLVSRHRLMMAANRKQFAFNVLSLLRSMSSAKSTCLRGTAYDRS